MSIQRHVSTKTGFWATGAALAMLAFGPCANATVVRINFSAAAGNGYADLTIAPDPDASSLYQPNFSQTDADNNISPPLSLHDPEGAWHITSASGSFNGTTITNVIPTSPGTAPPGETLPKSFSWLGAGTAAQSSYDDLFYPDGSPLVCPPSGVPPYTFHGGFLDIFGVMFALGNGDIVGLWSDGVVPPNVLGTPGGGLTFGLSTFTPNVSGGFTISSFQFAGAMAAVPEPNFLWLFGAAVLGLFAWRRSLDPRERS